MNLKNFYVLSMAMLLLACSEDHELVGYKTRAVDSLEELAKISCKSDNDGEQILVSREDDPVFTCKSGVWKNDHDVVVGEKNSSSSGAKSSSSTKDKSSSSAKSSSSKRVSEEDDDSEVVVSKRSSSSKTADSTVSSSSIVINNDYTPESKLGSCEPVSPVIEKGESVAWKFKLNASNDVGVKVTDLMRGEFNWKFDGGAVVSDDEKKTFTSSNVVYSKSGSYGASVKISIGSVVETVTCSSLHVNGDPITGCECGTAATSVDFTATPDVAWTVTGCKSASEISYEWEGAAGTDSFTKTFDAATASYAPKLKVKNSDNTAIDVTCPAVKITEGAEYVIRIEGDILSSEKIEVTSGSCISVVGTWRDAAFNPTVMIVCDMEADYTHDYTSRVDEHDVSFRMSYRGEFYEAKRVSYWGFNREGMTIGRLMEGNILFEDICVEFTGADFITCGLSM